MGKNLVPREKNIRIFISSPKDVKKERNIAAKLVGSVNQLLQPILNINLDFFRWEIDSIPGMGNPQNILNEAAKINECDVFIGIFWHRFGSPTGNKNPYTGELFKSGTEEEFFFAYDSWKKYKRPHILFYRCERSPESMSNLDTVQYEAIQKFFEAFESGGSTPGLYKSYNQVSEFQSLFMKDFAATLKQLIQLQPRSSTTQLTKEHGESGFLDLYTTAQNELRNDAKRYSLRNSKEAYMMAYGGHSYIAMHNHRFKREVELMLESGGSFKAIVLNPWCEWSFWKALFYSEEYKDYQLQSLNHFNQTMIEEIINKSIPYRITWANSIEGYKYLKRKYDNRIQVRYTSIPMEATLLITDEYTFFEPYLMSTVSDRAQKVLNSFELRVEASSAFAQVVNREFQSRWKAATDLDYFIENEYDIKQKFLMGINKSAEIELHS